MVLIIKVVSDIVLVKEIEIDLLHLLVTSKVRVKEVYVEVIYYKSISLGKYIFLSDSDRVINR